MRSACENLHPFADGELDGTEHGRFEDHLLGCDECALGLEDILVLGSLADQVSQHDASYRQRLQATPLARATAGQAPWWRLVCWPWRWTLNAQWRWMTGVTAAAAALVIVVLVGGGGSRPDALLIAEIQARPYRTTEARLAAPELSGYRPLSVQRGEEHRLVNSMTTMRQQGLAALESARRYHLLGVVYLLGQQYARAERILADAPEKPELWNDRAVLAYQRGRMDEALAWVDRALAEAPEHSAALWNRGLALEGLGRFAEAARAFEDCAARNELGWSAEATLRASVLRAKRAPAEGLR